MSAGRELGLFKGWRGEIKRLITLNEEKTGMTKTRWRIYTEYTHTRHVAEIVDKYFADYSMFSGIGHYGGEKERCLVIEIITSSRLNSNDIVAICREINTLNHQECCLVTSEQVDVMVVSDKVPSTV